MTLALLIIGLLVLVLLPGKIRLSLRFRKQVADMYINSGNVYDKYFSMDQIYGLPAPVQRYFKYALKTGQPYIETARLKHTGLFKTGLKKKFISITGEQHFTVQNPQFIWKGAASFFTAVDSFIAGSRQLKVALLDLFPVVNGHGSTFNEAELQRWMAESVWFPTNLLPSDMVTWSAIDENTAKLSLCYKAISFHFIVTFSAQGQIIVMETQRFMTDKKRETWICKMSDYKEINNMKIPFTAEAIWKLPTGYYSYAKFTIAKIEYNLPESF